ncbi:MAG: tetratricopeptide repeat protein, partial [Nannocystaceae bacterium]
VQQYEEVLNIIPGQEGAISDLINLSSHAEVSQEIEVIVRPQLEQLGRFEDLVQVLRNRIGHVEDPLDKAQRVEEIVEICNDRLSDAGAAYQSSLALLEVAEGEALTRGLERGLKLAAQLESLDSFAERCGALASQESKDNASRCALGLAAANTLYNLQAQTDEAIALLDGLLSAGVSSVELCECIERFAGEQGQSATVVRALEEHTRLPDADGMPALLVRLGAARARSGDTEGAVDAFREALQEDALVQGAVEGIREIAEGMELSDIPADGLDTLSQAYQATDFVEGLIFVARARLSQAEDESSMLAFQQDLARLQDRATGASAESLDAWCVVLTADADHGEALDRALEIAGEIGHDAHLAERLVGAVTKAKEDGRIYGKTALAAGQLFVEKLRDSVRATGVLADLFEEVPGHVRGLALCVEAARISSEPAALYEALIALADVTEDTEETLTMLREAAEIAEGPMADPARAIAALNSVLMADESDAASAQKLMTMLHHGERFEELSELLRSRVMVAEDDAVRRQLRYSLANLLAERLDAVDEAVEVYGDMLADDYADLEALQEQEILLRRLERWSDVRDLLERKQETVDPSQRTPIMMEMARLCDERLGASGEASEIYGRILLEQPALEEARVSMERIFRAEEQWEELAASLEARLEAATASGDDDAIAAATYRLTDILAAKLEQIDRAQELLKEVLERRPDDVHGILALADVYEARGDEGAMRLMLQRAASLAPQGQEGAALQLRLSTLSDDPDAQRVHLEQALGLDPSNAEAASRLLELSRKSEAWDRVAYLLELAASRAEDPAERRRLTLERTDVLAYQLGDANSALRVLAGIYEQVADDIDINARIADLLFRVGQFGEAAGMYRWLVEAEAARNARSKSLAVYLTRLARIELSEGRRDEAMAMLDRAYGMDSTNVELLMVLGDIHEQTQSWEDALKVYRAMLLQNADRSGLLRRGDIYLHLSEIHRQLDELPKAQAMLRRGLQEDPEHPDLALRLQQLGA